MDGLTLQSLGLVSLVAAMVITLYDMRSSLKPVACDECPHCRARAEAEALEQERLSREYAHRVGLDDPDEEDHRRIG